MKKNVVHILLMLVMILITPDGYAQRGPEKAGRLEEGKFTLSIDLNWNPEQQQQLAGLFDLDAILLDAIFKRNLTYINDSTDWVAIMTGASRMELYRRLDAETDNESSLAGIDKILLAAEPASRFPLIAHPAPPIFGINNFSKTGVFNYEDGEACFRLPGYSGARSVYLSGSFNNWSTMQTPMRREDQDWTVCINLPPGRHLYKYIVDGRWIHDPNNRLRERDGQRGFNSLVYTYNQTFRLEGYPRARRVFVAGSFNGWNTRNLQMNRAEGGWELPVFLGEGTHTYKFIVDRNWIIDPANPITMPDGDGNINSVIGIGDTLYFTLNGFTDAERVVLSGSFNSWRTGELRMERIQGGWQLPYVPGTGNFEYKYIIDGRWTIDPDNPFTVGRGDFTNSFMVNNPNHVFTLDGYENAENVIVTGTFNGWSTQDYRMVKMGNRWVFPIRLEPGRHSYKFIVDGEWIIDPDNTLWEQNEFGTGNSVLWME